MYEGQVTRWPNGSQYKTIAAECLSRPPAAAPAGPDAEPSKWAETGTGSGHTWKKEGRRLAVASPHRAQADETSFHYAATMIGRFSAIALFAAYLYRRFLRSTKPEDHRF